MDAQATEQRAAKILLKRGVKVPVTAPLFLQIFGKKKIVFTITAPTLHTLLLISEKFLSMRITDSKDMSLPEAFELLKNHGKQMTEIIAICILNNSKRQWRHRYLARFLERKLKSEDLSYLFQLIILYGGIEDFINTIRSAETVRITKPMNLSPEEKTS